MDKNSPNNQELWQRFFELRKRIFKMIEEIDEGYHKSYEGAVEVRFEFDNIYQSKSIEDIELVEIELHCYLLVNGRHITWTGKTFEEALNKMDNWVIETEGWMQEEAKND